MSMNQKPPGQSCRGIFSKFIPHIPLMTTKGMLTVATTLNVLVIDPRRLDTCVK